MKVTSLELAQVARELHYLWEELEFATTSRQRGRIYRSIEHYEGMKKQLESVSTERTGNPEIDHLNAEIAMLQIRLDSADDEQAKGILRRQVNGKRLWLEKLQASLVENN